MLSLSQLQVKSFDLGFLDIFWEVEPCSEDVLDYELIVQRSDSLLGPYDDVSPALIDLNHFRDATLIGHHDRYHKLYYRVIVRRRGSDESVTFPPDGGVKLEALPDLAALEMARLNNLRLKEFAGREIWVFTRRRSGQRCTCFDVVLQRRLTANCTTCYGTGWAGGYYAPIRTYGLLHTPDEVTQPAQFGKIQTQDTYLQVGNFPELYESDVVVEGENTRWRVGNRISKVKKGRALIRQQAVVHSIPPGDVEYRLPLNFTDQEIRSLNTSPDRNYTNPSTLHDQDVLACMKAVVQGRYADG